MNKKMINGSIFSTIMIAICGGYLSLIYIVGPLAWDDGAITFSFARTLSKTGLFALTPESTIVEGTSSLLFTFILSIIYSTHDFSFNVMISIGQMASLTFLIFSALYIYFKLKEFSFSVLERSALSSAFALLPMHIAEVLNGMEMTLFGFLLIVYAGEYKKNGYAPLVLIPLILLTRFESIFYLVSALSFLSLLGLFHGSPRKPLLHLSTTLLTFLLISFVRYGYFDSLLPNTIIAKLNAKYSGEGITEILKKILGLTEFIAVNSAYLFAITYSIFLVGVKKIIGRTEIILSAAFLLFAVIAGNVSGYDGRLYVGALPLLTISAICCLSYTVNNVVQHLQMRQQRLFRISIVTVLFMFPMNAELLYEQLTLAGKAIRYNKIRLNQSSSEKQLAYSKMWLGVSPENTRITGETVEVVPENRTVV